MSRATFNLIDQPWLGAIDQQGKLQEVSLHTLLTNAHQLQALYDDSPLVIAATMRMLLALLHRIYQGPENRDAWRQLWQTEQFDTEMLEHYFQEWYHRFDLFDTAHPFYQTLDAGADGQQKRIATLLPELAGGNNATLFDHTTDEQDVVLLPAQAARALVSAQSFGLAGPCNPKLKLYFTDGTAARGIIFMAEGNTLFETLLLNLIEYPAQQPISTGENDCPAWEMDNPYADEREIPHGYLDYLTWQNRKILLTPVQTTGGIVVREMALTPGLKLDPSVLDQDPMKHYRINAKSGHVSLRFQEHRALWRDSVALLRLSAEEQQVPAIFAWLGRLAGGMQPVLEERLSLRYMALGMASDQAKIEFFRHEHLPLPVAYLDNPQLVDLLGHSLSAAEAVASELWRAGTTIANLLLDPEENSERRANPDDVRHLRDNMALERRYWAQLEPLFRQTMQALPTTGTAAVVDWFTWLRRSAWSAFEEVSIGLGDQPRALKAAVRGREQLARGLGKVLAVD